MKIGRIAIVTRCLIALTLAVSVSAYSTQNSDEASLSELSTLVKTLYRQNPSGAFDLARLAHKWAVPDPEKTLRPGDILLFPQSAHGLKAPTAYRAALEGLTHASIVARDPDGKLFHLDAPFDPAPDAYNLKGQDAYFILRPKLPPGTNLSDFYQRVNRTAQYLVWNSYPYDASMQPTFLDPANMEKLRKAILLTPWSDPHSRVKIPGQYCSGLTQTVEKLGGAGLAKSVSMNHLLDLALANIERESGKKHLDANERKDLANHAVDELIDMYSSFPRQALAGLNKRLSVGIQDPQEAQWTKTAIKSEEEQLRKFQWAKGLIKMILAAKLNGANEQTPFFGKFLGQKVVRPIDIFNEATRGDGNYSLIGYYPGRLEDAIPAVTNGREHSKEPAREVASNTTH